MARVALVMVGGVLAAGAFAGHQIAVAIQQALTNGGIG